MGEISFEKVMGFVVKESYKNETFRDILFCPTCIMYWGSACSEEIADECLVFILDNVNNYIGEDRERMLDLFQIYCKAYLNADHELPLSVTDVEFTGVKQKDYDPNQPRVEKGNPHGGEWKSNKTDEEIIKERKEFLKSYKQIKTIEKGQQNKHVVGTNEYKQYKEKFAKKGEFGPSYLTISLEEVQELIYKYCSKGEIKLDKNKNPFEFETILTNDKIVGFSVNNLTGKESETSVFKIHYGKRGTHLVPDYPSKKVNNNMIKDSQGKEIKDIWYYMYKRVKITLNDGKVFIGYPNGYSTWADSGTGKDMIDLNCGHKDWGYSFPLDDIKTIEEIPED